MPRARGSSRIWGRSTCGRAGPICYTSADSVFQIAAHEESFGNDRLQKLCKDLAPTLHAMKVGRVIPAPFVGTPGQFTRTGNRPRLCGGAAQPGPVRLGAGGGAQGCTPWARSADIFSMAGIDDVVKGSDAELMDHLDRLLGEAQDGSSDLRQFRGIRQPSMDIGAIFRDMPARWNGSTSGSAR